MANNCMVGIRITSISETDGKQLHDKLIRLQAKAYLKGERVLVEDIFDLFDSVIYRDRDTILIFGRVTSNFRDRDAKALITWMMEQGAIKECLLTYEDSKKTLYGEYRYADGKLIKYYLPKVNYPEDDGIGDFGITLEATLKRYGVTVEITMA